MKNFSWLAVLSLVVSLLGLSVFLFTGSLDLSLTMHDTYLVIGYSSIGFGVFILYILSCVFYVFKRKFNFLSVFHILAVLPIMVFCLLIENHYLKMSGPCRRYYTNSNPFDESYESMFIYLLIICAIFLLGQLLFILNVGLTLIRRFKS